MTTPQTVAVVGAGLVGLTVAWTCRRAGADVVVVDPEPASGATRAAAGMLAAAAETHHCEEPLSALLAASGALYGPLVDDVAAHTDLPTGHRRTRTLVVGADAADRRALADLHALCLRLGLTTEVLTTREARRLEPGLSPAVAGAFLAPDDHQVDPRLLAAALLDALDRSGARLVPERAAEVGPHGVRCETTRVQADAVVVANALGARELGGLPLDLAPALRPVHGDIVRLGPMPDGTACVEGTVRGLVGGVPVYLVPRDDGSLVLGATSREDGRDAVSAGGVHELLRDAVRLVPDVAEHTVTELLARPRPATPDNLPLLGAVAGGLVVATGFGRNGILLAPLAGVAVARLLGLDPPWAPDHLPDLTPADPARFERTHP